LSTRSHPIFSGLAKQRTPQPSSATRTAWINCSSAARGRTNAEIGAELHISVSTVKFHVASLMTKLGARNRVELAMWAYETKRVT
jgi:DNA-binding NarL/FixJ family response regulator